jgi:hypothetical protein
LRRSSAIPSVRARAEAHCPRARGRHAPGILPACQGTARRDAARTAGRA